MFRVTHLAADRFRGSQVRTFPHQAQPNCCHAPGRSRIQYRELKQVLLEVDREATEILTRKPSRFTIPFNLLTSMDTYRISLDVRV